MQSEAALSREAAILVELRDRYERDRNYVEADIAKRRLEDLRQHEEARRGETLRSRQVAQRLGIEESHMIEFQQFNAMWDRTMKEYEERAGELLEAMRQRHEIDVRELLHTKSSRAPTAIKQSPKLLDLRRIEETLAKQVCPQSSSSHAPPTRPVSCLRVCHACLRAITSRHTRPSCEPTGSRPRNRSALWKGVRSSSPRPRPPFCSGKSRR